jgi:tetratricopeptide (TPR) repeat protein
MVAGQRTRSQRSASPPTPDTPTASSGRQSASPQDFDRLAAQAEEARNGGHFDQATELYRKALGLHPQWVEGWWYLATLLYDHDVYADAARAFAKATELQPKAGAAWAMLGLCGYQLGRYDDALGHLYQARQIGLLNNPDLIRVMIYHEGLLLLLRGEFETAYQRFGTLAYEEGVSNEDLIIALGLSSLRIPVTPTQIGPKHRDRELIRRVGWAELQSAQRNRTDAQSEYERILADYPKTPNLQYAYGRFLMTSRRDDDGALAAFQKEIENAPDSAVARIQIAYLKLKNKDAAAGIPYAEDALKFAPRNPVGHYILGRLLFDVGQTDRSIKELESARQLAPEAANIYFALARAYTRAKRKEDADRARETFTRLNKQNEGRDDKGFIVTGDAPSSSETAPP